MGVVIRAMNPFWVLLLITLLIITYVPAVSLWLPRSMGL
jgi:TRAP-type C4-dicarboxylate transport system permease large subunit